MFFVLGPSHLGSIMFTNTRRLSGWYRIVGTVFCSSVFLGDAYVWQCVPQLCLMYSLDLVANQYLRFAISMSLVSVTV